MKRIIVNLVSEFHHGPPAHGLYVAFRDAIELTKASPEVDLRINSYKRSDIIHSHSFLPYYLYKSFLRKAKKILTLHVIPDSLNESLVLAKYWMPLFKLYLRFVCNFSDVIICVGSLEKKKLRELGIRSRIEFIPNYIKVEERFFDSRDREKIRNQYNISADDFVVVSVGQQIERKGIFEFMETAKYFPDAKFVWIGGLPYKFNFLSHRGDIIQRAIDSASGNVIFTGILPRADVFRWLNASDTMLFASHQEIHPLVVIEAAAFGLPLIMKDLEEYRETFFDLFIKANQPQEMIKAIQDLKSNKEFYQEYREKSKQIASLYNEKTTREKIIRLYKNVLHL